MTATTPLPSRQHPRLYPSYLETFQLLENHDDPPAVNILPWPGQVLVDDRLPAGQEEQSAAMGLRSAVEVFAAPHHRLALARAVAAAFVEIVDELLAVLEEGERAPAPVLRTDQSRPSDSLISPREREVLALVVAGRSNKEIAEALFISPYTVKAHVASLLTKLDADNRAQLAGIAIQRGLLADADRGLSRRRLAAGARDERHPAPISSWH